VGGDKKLSLIRRSKALLFPVLWHEPFGNAMMESMYFGCPVLGTPFGILPEIIRAEVGLLSTSISELAEQLKNINDFNRNTIHQYIMDNFTMRNMADNYEKCYEKVLNGKTLNNQQPYADPAIPISGFTMDE
jgi:glycosyltransferase involved in cell wall biosynthesis